MEEIDLRIIAKFQKGSNDGFIAIHRRFYKKAFRQAFEMVRGEDEAQDIVAESFFSLWEKREALSTVPDIVTYLRVVIHNKCLNYIKHQGVVSAHQARIFNLYSVHEQDIAVETKRVREERLQLILDEIEKLPPRCKQVMKLFLKEYSDDQIAQTLKISKKTVHNTKYNALKMLKERFKAHPGVYMLLLSILQNDKIIN